MMSFVIVEAGSVVAEVYARDAAHAIEEVLVNVAEGEKIARREQMVAYPKPQITGEMIHDAYCKTVEGERLTLPWQQMSEEGQRHYQTMARHLNEVLR